MNLSRSDGELPYPEGMAPLRLDTSNLILPEGMGLYVCSGVTQMFRRSADDGAKDSWLYLPSNVLTSMLAGKGNPVGEKSKYWLATKPVELNDFNLYLVIVETSIVALVVDPLKSGATLNESMLTELVDQLVEQHERRGYRRAQYSAEFVSALMGADVDINEFNRRFLKLVSDQVPKGLAGLYCLRDGLLSLRIAVGNISLSDLLPCDLGLTETQRFTDTVRRGELFLPGDLLPEYPAMLENPPTFLFVHPGVQSDRYESIVAIALSADSDFATIERVREYSRLVACLHDTQFVSTAPILPLYGRLESTQAGGLELTSLMLDIFKTIDDQVELSRLVFFTDESRSIGIIGNPSADPVVFESDFDSLPDSISRPLEKGSWLCPDILSMELSDAEQCELQDQNVRSEYYVPISLAGGVGGVVSFGSPNPGGNLKRLTGLLEGAAQLIRMVSIMQAEQSQAVLPAESDVHSNSQAIANRFLTVSRLTDGYFHDILGQLSIIVGQSEIIKRVHGEASVRSGSGSSTSATERIVSAIDDLSFYLSHLRDICSFDTTLGERMILASDFVRNLKAILHGRLRQIRDTKNIILMTETDTNVRSQITLWHTDIYDFILPIILEVTEEAICSGTIKAFVQHTNNTESLVVEFKQDIIGQHSLVDLVERVCGRSLIKSATGDSGEASVGRINIKAVTSSDVGCRLEISPNENASDNLQRALTEQIYPLEENN